MAIGQIVFDGNSLTVGYDAHTGHAFPDLIYAHGGGTFDMTNLAVSGQTTQQMTADGVAQVDALYSAGRDFNVLVAWEIRNDYIANSLTATQAYNNFKAYCQARRAAGWKVVAITMPPTTAYDKPANYDADRATINAAIRTHLADFADGLADMALDEWIGPDLASNDQAYYVNGVHLLDLGHLRMAGIVQAALTALLPGTFDFSYAGPGSIAEGIPDPDISVQLVPATGVPEDITDLVDMDSLGWLFSERGEASATVVIPVASENDIPSNYMTQDVGVAIYVNGGREWLGHVAGLHKPQPADLKWTLDCAGGWADLSKCAAWCKGFVENDYAKFVEAPKYLYEYLVGKVASNVDVNFDGQVQFILPKGSKTKTDQSKLYYYLPLGGLREIGAITRITGKWNCGGNSMLSAVVGACTDTPFSDITDYVFVSSVLSRADSSGRFDSDDLAAGTGLDYADYKFVVVGAMAFSDTSETTQENFCQLTELTIYIDRATAPTIDEIVVTIDAEARPDGATASSETIGDPQVPCMFEPFMTPRDGIVQALAKTPLPPLCGIWQNRMTIKARPIAPDGASHLWVVSEQMTPGLEWGVEIDEEQSVDYVGCSYTAVAATGDPLSYSDNAIPTMTSNSAPRGVALASAEYNSTYAAWKALDKNLDTFWSSGVVPPAWLQYKFSLPIAIAAYSITALSTDGTPTPSTWTFLGSNDGAAWATLDTHTGVTWSAGQARTYTFANVVPYRYYRINVTAVAGGGATWVAIAELGMMFVSSVSAAPDGTPMLLWYPSTPTDIPSSRCGLVDAGERAYADALLYAAQAYHWMHRRPSGPVVVPYRVQDVYGHEFPAEVIKSWDWIQNVGYIDEETEFRRPFLISDAQHSAGLATLTIGNLDAYEYNGPPLLEQAGKYRRGHYVATKKWEYKTGKKRPQGGRWRRHQGKWRRHQLRWIEGRYV